VIFHDPKVAAGAVVEQAGRVLLVQQSHGPKKDRWSIPAGFVEHDEPPALAAIRECREETGLEIELTGLLGIMSGGELPGEASFLIVYRGQITGGRLKPGDDAQRAAFFHRDRLPPLAYAPTRKALERWRKRQFP
jgi:8-oxo-dGTP diphosphatase